MSKVIFFTGAGISKAAGIPTFNDMPGIRDKLTRAFADEHPEEYMKTIYQMADTCRNIEPTIAHKAIAEKGYDVITMNVDGLHRGDNVLCLHGALPATTDAPVEEFMMNDTIFLYGDIAPNYRKAYDKVEKLEPGDFFVIVGTSLYTMISFELMRIAMNCGACVFFIDPNPPTGIANLDKYYNFVHIKETADIGVPMAIKMIEEEQPK